MARIRGSSGKYGEALDWVNCELAADPHKDWLALVEQASLRLGLFPLETDSLHREIAGRVREERSQRGKK